jgi:septal ring factor EnvC (AmiA/AmiB activator)
MKQHTANEFGCIKKKYCSNGCQDGTNQPTVLMESELEYHRSVCPLEIIPCSLCAGSLRTREHTQNLLIHMEQVVQSNIELKQSNVQLRTEINSLKDSIKQLNETIATIEKCSIKRKNNISNINSNSNSDSDEQTNSKKKTKISNTNSNSTSTSMHVSFVTTFDLSAFYIGQEIDVRHWQIW